jgi:hypothetical protein
MPKPTLGQVAASIVDPMLSDNFQFNIPNAPTGDSTVPLLLQCTAVNKPGFTINNIEVVIFGHTLEYAGQKTFGHDLTTELVENRMAQITNILEKWGELCRSTTGQHGSYKNTGSDNGYARDGYLTIFDQAGAIVKEYVVHNCWPSSVPDLSFSGSSVSNITLSVGWKYDYYTERSV